MNISHLKLLAVFACVVENESFAEAARKLSTSRSRVSEQVSALEELLGIRLLQRSTRQLNITSEGLDIYQQVRNLSGTLEAVEAIASPSSPSGKVVITMNHDVAHRFILPKLKDFHKRYPDIQLDLILDDSPLDLIREQIDLGIRIGFPKDDSLIARALHQDHLALFASPQFLEENLGSQSIQSISQLQGLQWILLKQKSFSDTLFFEYCGEPIELKTKKFYRCNSPMMMEKMAIQGLGVASLLPSTIQKEMVAGTLVHIMPEIKSPTIYFSLVYPSRKQVPKRTRALINYLLEEGLINTD